MSCGGSWWPEWYGDVFSPSCSASLILLTAPHHPTPLVSMLGVSSSNRPQNALQFYAFSFSVSSLEYALRVNLILFGASSIFLVRSLLLVTCVLHFPDVPVELMHLMF
jgi:hypothetical protein